MDTTDNAGTYYPSLSSNKLILLKFVLFIPVAVAI